MSNSVELGMKVVDYCEGCSIPGIGIRDSCPVKQFRVGFRKSCSIEKEQERAQGLGLDTPFGIEDYRRERYRRYSRVLDIICPRGDGKQEQGYVVVFEKERKS